MGVEHVTFAGAVKAIITFWVLLFGGAAVFMSFSSKREEPRMPVEDCDQILSCAYRGDVDTIARLLLAGCPASFANPFGQSALHIGAVWGNEGVVKVLILARAAVNAQNRFGQTPLHSAAESKGCVHEALACVNLLVEAKASLELCDRNGQAPKDTTEQTELRIALGGSPLILHEAVKARSESDLLDGISLIQRSPANDQSIDMTNCSRQTALALAVSLHWTKGALALLRAGSSVVGSDTLRQTPLHLAAKNGQFRLAEAFIHARANVHACDAVPEYNPNQSNNTNQPENRTALHYAAELMCVPLMRVLLRSRSDPNAKDWKLRTPLQLLIEAYRFDACIKLGSGIKLSGTLAEAESQGCLGSVVGFAQCVDDASNEEHWPVLLDKADSSENILSEHDLRLSTDEAIDILLEARVDVNVGNQEQGESFTVLHQVSRMGDSHLAAKILAARADVCLQDAKHGLSALHVAAKSKNYDIVRLLLEAQADTSRRIQSGKTAADLAALNGAGAEIVQMLGGSAISAITPAVIHDVIALTAE